MDSGNQVSTLALVLIAASGGVGALLSGLVTAWVNARNDKRAESREHAQWLRNEKIRTFSELMGAINLLIQTDLLAPKDNNKKLYALERVSYAIGPAFIFADSKTEVLLQKLYDDTRTFLQADENHRKLRPLADASKQLRLNLAAQIGVAKGTDLKPAEIRKG